MNKLDELIQQLCPDGVEYKSLGEVCNSISDGSHNPPKGVGESSYIMISSQNIQPNGLSFDNVRYLTTEDFEKENKRTNVSFGDVLLTIVGTIGRSYVVKENDPKLTLQRSVAILHPSKKINSYFLHYYLLEINSILNRLANGAAQKGIYLNQLSNIEIPLPPLSVQEEIVRILDTFTESTNNLKEQIQTRRKQYEYYRNQLLTFDTSRTDVEWTKISDICLNICSGGTPSTSHEEYYHGNIPWLRTQEVDWKEINDTEIKITDDAITNSSAKIIPANCVIVAMYGATAAKAAINKIPLSTNQACCNLEIDSNKALYGYVYQWFCKEYDKLKAMGEGSQNNINGKKVKDYPISLPPLTEQERIVNILAKFEASITNFELQLKQREKQYEYYRNQLMDFKKKEE